MIYRESLKTVRLKGLEPIRRETLDPKSSAATNYATAANRLCDNGCKDTIFFFPSKNFKSFFTACLPALSGSCGRIL